MNSLLFFFYVLKASLFSTGGMGNVPSLHDDMLAKQWATEKLFAESLTIGQIAPGPNGLWVLSLGYLTDGVRGALLALGAILLPPLFVIPIERLYHQVREHPAAQGFLRGLGTAVVGIFVVVLCRLLQGVGVDSRSLCIALAAFVLGATRHVPVFLLLLLAALAGILLKRQGL